MPTSLVADRRAPAWGALNERSAPARRALGERGYTAIEVLLAMTVMAIGAASVMSMQKTSMQANLDARKMDIANAIARTWVERLQRDAMQWTLPSSASPSAGSNLSNAQILSAKIDGGWFVPNEYMGGTPETMSYGFDILGRDLASADIASSAVFCVSLNIVTLVTNQTNQLYRADVRVLWPRDIGDIPTPPPPTLTSPFCSTTSADMTASDPNAHYAPYLRYRGVYVTTALRENAAQ